jgi:hypothetical protein
VPAADVYAARLAARREQLTALERRHVRLSRLRLGFVGLTILEPVAFGLGALEWAGIPFARFLATAVVHARALDARRRAGVGGAVYGRGRARL